MGRTVTFDFTDAPPAQGGGGSDKVPPGIYALQLANIDDTKASSGKRMVKAGWTILQPAEYANKRLMDNFVLEGAKFGLQRLHACFLALSLPVAEKAVSVDLDALVGHKCLARVADDVIPANDQYPERAVSKIFEYHPVSAAKALMAANGKAPAAAPAPAPAPVQTIAAAPAAVAVAEPAPAPVQEAAPIAAQPDVSDIDDLFN